MRSPGWSVPFGITEAAALGRASGCRGRRASCWLTLCGLGSDGQVDQSLLRRCWWRLSRAPRPGPCSPARPSPEAGVRDGTEWPRHSDSDSNVQPSHWALSEPPAGLSSWLRGGGGGSLVWRHHAGSWELGFANRSHRSELLAPGFTLAPPRGCSAEAWEGLAVC